MNRIAASCSLIAAALMALASPAVAVPAPGLDLAWSNCASQGGASNQNFACDDDFVLETLVGTFVLAGPVTGVTVIECSLDLISANPTLPAWWKFEVGGCAEGNLSANPTAPAGALCTDWANGTAAGGLGGYGDVAFNFPPPPGSDAEHRRAGVGFAVPAPKDLVVATEYFVFNLVINTSHTVAGPPGPCAGCTTPVCIVLNTVNVVPGTNPGTRIGAPSSGSSNQATWQGAGGAICAAVPVKNATWGQVKALYR